MRARIYTPDNIENNTSKEPGSDAIKNSIPQLNIFYTVEKPGLAAEKLTFTKTRLFQPRVYVYKDQLVLRKTVPQDTGVYTCVYRGRPRIVWAVTVLPAGVEPYRQTIAPAVNLKLDQVDVKPAQNLRTLGQKTVARSNIQVRFCA